MVLYNVLKKTWGAKQPAEATPSCSWTVVAPLTQVLVQPQHPDSLMLDFRLFSSFKRLVAGQGQPAAGLAQTNMD